MTRPAFLSFSLALGVLLTGAIGMSAFTRLNVARHSAFASGSVDDEHALGPEAERAEARRKLQAGESGTYIGEILAERDSAVARWPDRGDRPLTVWIQPQSSIADFDKLYVDQVHEAFEEWDRLQLPLHFAFIPDSADADIHVNWIDHFSEPISGRTRWTRDDDYVITDANIVLAVHHNLGDRLDNDAMYAMSLHEIGHLLGLDHTQDTLSIMASRVRVRELSDADRATVRLIYALPAGPLQ